MLRAHNNIADADNHGADVCWKGAWICYKKLRLVGCDEVTYDPCSKGEFISYFILMTGQSPFLYYVHKASKSNFIITGIVLDCWKGMDK